MTEVVNYNYSMKIQTRPVTIQCIDGVVRQYTLKELSGEALVEFSDEVKDKVVTKPNGEVIVKSNKGVHASLLTRALYDENDQPVTADFVAKMPSTMLNRIFDDAKKLSGIGAVDDTEKN